MKIIELTSYVQMPVTNEEYDLLAKFKPDSTILKSDLELREQVLAAHLVNKGALIRKNNNGHIEFRRHFNN